MTEYKAAIQKLEHGIKVADAGKSRYRILSWLIAILVAAAGVFTASSGTFSESENWWSTSTALIVCGLITALGATINKTVDPTNKSEWFKKLKRAYQLILNKLHESNSRGDNSFSPFDAERYRILAKEDPDLVLATFLKEVMPNKQNQNGQ